MASEVSTIQSLKAVDAWIDVINANINGGVRTAFKSSRLKFSGSNTDVQRAGSSTGLPLQFPEPGLTTANTVIDFTQGAITASTESTHLAIQGEGFFLLASPDIIQTGSNGVSGSAALATTRKFLLTRDGEFHTNQDGLLVHSSGYYLVTFGNSGGVPIWNSGTTQYVRGVYNDLDLSAPSTNATKAYILSEFLTKPPTNTHTLADGTVLGGTTWSSVIHVSNPQSLVFSQFGSTVFDFGYYQDGSAANGAKNASLSLSYQSDSTILSKSLEASNASMTQSVPELSLAQKLFSALTKVLQTKQTNVDGVLNLVR
jgi:flagellar hook protein FlgE